MRVRAQGTSARGRTRLRDVTAWLALLAGVLLGAVLAGTLQAPPPSEETVATQVDRLHRSLASARAETEALARLLRTRDIGDITPAPADVVRLVDATATAVNAADVTALERLFTSNAVVTDLSAERVTRGAAAIALAYGQLDDAHLARTTEVLVVEGRAVWAYDTGLCVGDVSEGRFRRLVLLR